MQAGAQGNTVNACIQCGVKTHLQRIARRVHGQFFHAVDKHHAVTPFGFHGGSDMQFRRLGQATQVKLHNAFVGVVNVVLVELGFFFDEVCVEPPV